MYPKTCIKAIFATCMLSLLALSTVAAEDTLKVHRTKSGPNDSVAVELSVSNSSPFVGFQFDLQIPPTLTLNQKNSGKLSGRASDHTLSISRISTETIRVVAYSAGQSVFSGDSGKVVTLFLRSGTDPGSYKLNLSNGILADTAQQNILDYMIDGTYTLVAPDIHIAKEEIDFGEVPLNATRQRTFTIENRGNDTLQVAGYTLDHSAYSLSGIGSEHLIKPNTSIRPTVTYAPNKRGDQPAVLNLQSSDPDEASQSIQLKAHAFAVNELHVKKATGETGERVTIPVYMNNMDPITASELTIELPDIAEYVRGSASLSNRKQDHVITADTTNSRLTIVAYSSTNARFEGNKGKLFEFELRLTGDRGRYPLKVHKALLTDTSRTNVLSNATGGSISLKAPHIDLSTSKVDFGSIPVQDTTKATVTIQNRGSDTLNIKEVQNPSSHVEVLATSPINIPPSANRNLSLKVYSDTSGNLNSRIRLLHNDQPRNPSSLRVQAEFFEPNQLDVLDTESRPEDKHTFWISLHNFTDIAGVQFDLTLPSLFKLKNIFLTRRKQDHTLASESITDTSNTYRILSFSSSGKIFTEQTDTLMGVTVQTPNSPKTYDIHLQNVLLSDSKGNDVTSSVSKGVFKVAFDSLQGQVGYWSDSTSLVPEVSFKMRAVDTILTWQDKDGVFSSIIPDDTLRLRAHRELKHSDRNAISVADIVTLHRTIVGLDSAFSGIRSHIADVNRDGSIDIVDGFYLEQFILKRRSRFPVGGWSVMPQGNLRQLPEAKDTTAEYVVPEGDTSGLRFTGLLYGDINGSWPSVADSKSSHRWADARLIEENREEILPAENKYTIKLKGSSSGEVAGFQGVLSYNASNYEFKKLGSSLDSLSYSRWATENNRRLIKFLWHNLNQAKEFGKGETLARLTFIGDKGAGQNIQIEENYEMVGIKAHSVKGELWLGADSTATDIRKEGDAKPSKTLLKRAYPNPFNPTTRIRYTIAKSGPVRLIIYNSVGRSVKTLVNERQPPGKYRITFDAAGYSSGIYLYQLITDQYSKTRKMLYIK